MSINGAATSKNAEIKLTTAVGRQNGRKLPVFPGKMGHRLLELFTGPPERIDLSLRYVLVVSSTWFVVLWVEY